MGKTKKDLKNIFLHLKTSQMIINLKEEDETWYISKLARKSNSTYIYTQEIIRILEKEKIVIIKEEGREKQITLTEKGHELANILEEFIKKCEKETILPLN